MDLTSSTHKSVHLDLEPRYAVVHRSEAGQIIKSGFIRINNRI